MTIIGIDKKKCHECEKRRLVREVIINHEIDGTTYETYLCSECSEGLR